MPFCFCFGLVAAVVVAVVFVAAADVADSDSYGSGGSGMSIVLLLILPLPMCQASLGSLTYLLTHLLYFLISDIQITDKAAIKSIHLRHQKREINNDCFSVLSVVA